MPTILFAIATYGQLLGAFKLARYALNRLQSFHLPKHWIEEIDLSTLLVRTKPYVDDEELMPVCSRCQTINQLISSQVCEPGFFQKILFGCFPYDKNNLAHGSLSGCRSTKSVRTAATNLCDQC